MASDAPAKTYRSIRNTSRPTGNPVVVVHSLSFPCRKGVDYLTASLSSEAIPLSCWTPTGEPRKMATGAILKRPGILSMTR